MSQPTRRLVLAGLATTLALPTSPIATPALAQSTPVGAKLVMEDWLRGRTTAKGFFSIPLSNTRREFTMVNQGRWDGRVFTLVEDFLFADGERDRKTWRFTKLSPTRYSGVREDTVGEAEVIQEGDIVRMRYVLRVPTGTTTTDLGFEDVLWLDRRGILVNEAVIRLGFLPIGSAYVEFERPRRRR